MNERLVAASAASAFATDIGFCGDFFFFFRVYFQLWNIIESFICGPTTTETARERNRLMPYKLCWTLKHFVRIPSNARSD